MRHSKRRVAPEEASVDEPSNSSVPPAPPYLHPPAPPPPTLSRQSHAPKPQPPREFVQFGLSLPDQCFYDYSKLDLEIRSVGLTLTHNHSCAPLIWNDVRVVKLVAIVCEEYKVVSESSVSVNVTGPFQLQLNPTKEDRDRKFLDRLIGEDHTFRIWYACPPSNVNYVSEILPSLTLDDCLKGFIRAQDSSGQVKYYATFEVSRETGIPICALGYVTHWAVERGIFKGTYEQVEVPCEDKIERLGYILHKTEAERTIKMMVESVRDPRPCIPLQSFQIQGVSNSTPWSLNAGLRVFFSTHT